jgi:uncharacterized protein YyaL (SSP411 family)
MRTWRASAAGDEPDLQALFMATLTLTRMAEGGIYDQLGGGFSRYSVDQYWMIPHFEKMLYDNGQLLAVVAQAASATGEPLFRRIAEETADWMIRDLRESAGRVLLDTGRDSKDHEGKFYVWTPDEARALLKRTSMKFSRVASGSTANRTSKGAWHLHVYRSVGDIAAELSLEEAARRTSSTRRAPNCCRCATGASGRS